MSTQTAITFIRLKFVYPYTAFSAVSLFASKLDFTRFSVFPIGISAILSRIKRSVGFSE